MGKAMGIPNKHNVQVVNIKIRDLKISIKIQNEKPKKTKQIAYL